MVYKILKGVMKGNNITHSISRMHSRQFACADYQSECPWEKYGEKGLRESIQGSRWPTAYQCKEDINPICKCILLLTFVSKICLAYARELVHLKKWKVFEERYVLRNSWSRMVTITILLVRLLF